MRAVVLEKVGLNPSVIDADLPDPVPAPGELLVRVSACGFCHHDAAIMAGILRRGTTMPLVLGHEIAGVVEKVGNGVNPDWVGINVVLLPGPLGHRVNGGFAEFVCIPESTAVPALNSLAPDILCLSACPIGVAVKAVENVGRVEVGDWVAVTGVTGGVGSSAAQIAHARGAQVIGITTDELKAKSLESAQWLKAVLVHGSLSFDQGIFALTDGEGVDVLIDPVGGSFLAPGVNSLSKHGRMILVGQVDSEPGHILTAEIIFRQAQLLGSLGVGTEHIERAIALIDSTNVSPIIEKVLPLSAGSVLRTFNRMISRQGRGRTVFVLAGR